MLGLYRQTLALAMCTNSASIADAPACAAQTGVKLQNTVTLGATMLSNSTDSYASFAVLMDQALGRAVSLFVGAG